MTCTLNKEAHAMHRRQRTWGVLLAAAALLGGCSAALNSGGSGAGTGGATGSGGGAGVGGFNPSSGSMPVMGCMKVDLLFVIDNSNSMAAHQQNLAKSFPGFIQTIQNTLKGQDYHIMIVDTDAQDSCDDTCMGGAPFCALANGAKCADLGVATGCDATLGAGRVLGLGKQKQPCGPLDGGRFMTQNQQDLAGTFTCVATVGTYGQGNEQPMGALMAAVGGGAAGMCNKGFLRDDALLVVTVVTDAPPATGAEQVNGMPAVWVSTLAAAKAGKESSISVLGLVSDGDLPGGLCSTESGDAKLGAPKLRDWVGLFTYHVLASVCEPDYTQFFATAVKTIEDACNHFTPPK